MAANKNPLSIALFVGLSDFNNNHNFLTGNFKIQTKNEFLVHGIRVLGSLRQAWGQRTTLTLTAGLRSGIE